jgi:hypothetical protein
VCTKPVTVDQAGNRLDVGRERRMFTTKQRVTDSAHGALR